MELEGRRGGTWERFVSLTWKLSEPHPLWDFMETSLHRHD